MEDDGVGDTLTKVDVEPTLASMNRHEGDANAVTTLEATMTDGERRRLKAHGHTESSCQEMDTSVRTYNVEVVLATRSVRRRRAGRFVRR